MRKMNFENSNKNLTEILKKTVHQCTLKFVLLRWKIKIEKNKFCNKYNVKITASRRQENG